MDLKWLKRLYWESAPRLDPDGFKLYHAAVDITGVNLYSSFPYEDNRGMFEEMDGHQLLRWLTATYFQAVDWKIVPGTCCEAATLREIDTSSPEYQAFAQNLYQKALEKMGVIVMDTGISEINKDTFWELIAQAKARCGQDLDASAKWLEGQLKAMGPEQVLNFDSIMHGYSDLAYQYGLWTAASIMLNGCSDDGFADFRGWLIAQGKDIYLAALKDPDTLADVPLYGGGCFESLAYIGGAAYEKLTGKDIYDASDRSAYEEVKHELAQDIEYGDGIGYPYKWSEAAEYLPRLCGKYVPPMVLSQMIRHHDDTWNLSSPEVRRARAAGAKGKKKNRGDDR